MISRLCSLIKYVRTVHQRFRGCAGVETEENMLVSKTLPPKFAASLGGRSATISHLDFIRAIGELVEIRNGRILKNHPNTKKAKNMLLFLKRSAKSSRIVVKRRGKRG